MLRPYLFLAPPLVLFSPADTLMHTLVLAGGHYAKVFGVVVLPVAVDMVHHAAFVNLAANLLLGDSAMLILPLTIVIKVLDIPMINALLRPSRLAPQKQEIGGKGKREDGESEEVD